MRHVNQKHKNGRTWKGLQCKNCVKYFVNLTDLNVHKVSEHRDSMKKCNLCAEMVLSSRALHRHKLEVHGIGGFECKKCDKTFVENYELANHLKWNHDKNNPKLQFVDCAECGEVMRKSNFSTHFQSKH